MTSNWDIVRKAGQVLEDNAGKAQKMKAISARSLLLQCNLSTGSGSDMNNRTS